LNKTLTFTLTLAFLSASCIVFIEPAWAISEDSWTSKAVMLTKRVGFGVVVVNERIYTIGGYATNGDYLFDNTNEMYDPASDSWTILAPMPTRRVNFAIAVYKEKIYVIGGQNASHAISGPNFVDYWMDGVTGVNEIYDPATNTWETKSPMPTPRNYLQANVVDGKIYLIGGLYQQKLEYPPTEHSSNLTEVYDPETDSWTTMAPIPNTVYGYASAVINEKIYIISGWSNMSPLSDQVQIFNPNTNNWSLGNPIPVPVTLAGAGATTGIMASKRIYIIGGCPTANTQEAGGINTTQVYDLKTNRWSVGAEMPTSRYYLAVAVVNDMLYALGGASTPIVVTNEQYTPIGYGTPDPTYQTPTASPSQFPSPSPPQSPTPSSAISPSSSVPEFPSWMILTLLFAASAFLIVFRERKRLKFNQKK
jgi:N-acetylneuraminic acid mutarotase